MNTLTLSHEHKPRKLSLPRLVWVRPLLCSIDFRLSLWMVACAFTGLILATFVDTTDRDLRSRKPQSSRYQRGVQRFVRMNLKRRGGA